MITENFIQSLEQKNKNLKLFIPKLVGLILTFFRLCWNSVSVNQDKYEIHLEDKNKYDD